MLLLTGDIHGDTYRLKEYNNILCENDYLIVCGDLGIGMFEVENLYQLKYKLLFVDGNHENFDMLNSMKVTMWNGGKTHQIIKDRVIHLMRGQVFIIENKKIFTFGGARSVDVEAGIFEMDDPEIAFKIHRARMCRQRFRINHLDWWEEEMPSEAEYKEALCNLDKHNNNVDYIITHCASTSMLPMLGLELGYRMRGDKQTDYFNNIEDKVNFKQWYFGHYHRDIDIDDKHKVTYKYLYELK